MSTADSQLAASSARRMRRWRARLAHFGVTGWLGLAVIAFWAAAAVFGPALLSQQRRRWAAATCSRR